MITTYSLLITIAGTLTLASSPTSPSTQFSANKIGSCKDKVQECFIRSASERAECFHEAAQLDSCQGSDLGKLSLQRWLVAPDTTDLGDESQRIADLGVVEPELESTRARALIGNAVANQDCLNSFDNQLSAALIAQDGTSRATINSLRQALDKCTANKEVRLPTP